MPVLVVHSDAAEQITEDTVTDNEPEVKIDKEANDLENAQNAKIDADDDETLSNNEDEKLESGTFQPHAYPHLNWQGTSAPQEDRQTNSIHKPNNQPRKSLVANGISPTLPFGRGETGRRSSQVEQVSSEAAEAARAEAASWAQMTPLLAATFGPLSVLLGIPTLTQRWHGLVLDPPVLPNGASNFVELPDPPFNLILAGVSLFCEVMGNGFLVLRFSNFHTKVTTWVSYAFWMAKIILGIWNYVQFGIKHPETSNVIYLQGFWVGVCSMGVTVIILIFLTFNLAFLHRQSPVVTRRLHYVQRDFMMQTLLFFLFTGIAGLIFCKVERTTYVDGIYYMVVTTLTIGFGDITPQTVIMKVLTFPFTVIGIGLLALIVTSIVHLLADRARRRKAELKKRLKKKVSEKKRIHAGYGSKLRLWSARPPSGDGPRLKRSLTLQEELIKLHEDDWKRQRRANLKSMVTGFTVFLIFWFIGALIFYFVEVRIHPLKMLTIAMGIRKFSLLLFFLTIGFGDLFPSTEAGKPIFIVYALLAVPTMTIIVETITTNFTSFTMQRVYRRRHQVYEDKHFQIQSLTSLVKSAKKKASQKLHEDTSNARSVNPPLHQFTERITENLEQMHHHIQNLLIQKLGPDARNVITAERARQDRADNTAKKYSLQEDKRDPDLIARYLCEAGQDSKNELELLNDYRERYAGILAELLVAKDRLIELENTMQETADRTLRRALSEDIAQLSGDENDGNGTEKQKQRRRRSTVSSGGFSSDESHGPDPLNIRWRVWS